MKKQKLPFRPPLVFISYSRRDFNFAEAATAILNQGGEVKAWMDVEHLRPGMDWGKAIDSSLDTADVFLLIASPAALASAYVAKEWRRALQRGIPIHIAVVEAVDLPPELANYPVHDLRPHFWRTTKQISRLIATNTHQSTTAKLHTSKLDFFTKLPPSLIALVVLSAFVVLGLLYVASITWELYSVFTAAAEGFVSEKAILMIFYTAILTGTALTIIAVIGRLLYRQSSLGDLGYAFGMAAIFLLYSLQPIYGAVKNVVWFYQRPDLRLAEDLLSLTGFAMFIMFVAIAILLTRSRTIHLWLPMGETYYSLRQRLLGLAVTRRRKTRMVRPNFASQWKGYIARLRPLFSARKVTFTVYNEPFDEPIAKVIRTACEKAGLSWQKPKPQWTFILVSSMTDWAKVNGHYQKLGKKAIFVLVDNVQLPNDAVEFRRQQWLDFREQLPEGLFNLLVELGGSSSVHDSAPLPINPRRFRAPQTIRGLIVLCQTYLTMVGAMTLGIVLLKTARMSTWLLAGIAIPLIICFVQLLRRSATRHLTKKQFGILSMTTSLLLGVWLIILINSIPVAGDELPVLGSILGLSTFLSVSLALARIYFQVGRFWLPLALPRHSQSIPTAKPSLFASYLPLIAILGFSMAILFFAVE